MQRDPTTLAAPPRNPDDDGDMLSTTAPAPSTPHGPPRPAGPSYLDALDTMLLGGKDAAETKEGPGGAGEGGAGEGGAEKKRREPLPKLDAHLICTQKRGLAALQESSFPGFQPPGKKAGRGSIAKHLSLLMRAYSDWSTKLFPRQVGLTGFFDRVERMSTNHLVRSSMQAAREGRSATGLLLEGLGTFDDGDDGDDGDIFGGAVDGAVSIDMGPAAATAAAAGETGAAAVVEEPEHQNDPFDDENPFNDDDYTAVPAGQGSGTAGLPATAQVGEDEDEDVMAMAMDDLETMLSPIPHQSLATASASAETPRGVPSASEAGSTGTQSLAATQMLAPTQALEETQRGADSQVEEAEDDEDDEPPLFPGATQALEATQPLAATQALAATQPLAATQAIDSPGHEHDGEGSGDGGIAATQLVSLEPTQAVSLEPTQAVSLEPTQAVSLEPTQAVSLEPTQAVEETDAVSLEPTQAVVPTGSVIFTEIDAGDSADEGDASGGSRKRKASDAVDADDEEGHDGDERSASSSSPLSKKRKE